MKPYRSISYRIATWVIHLGVWLPVILLFAFWKTIPAQIPTHYNGAGEIDSWGGKGTLFMLVFLMFFIYGCHFIGVLFVKHSTTAENIYSKKLAPFVTEDDFLAGLSLTLAYLAWTDATVILMFVYIIFASAFSRTLGAWFIWGLVVLIFVELAWYLVILQKRKKIIRLRAAGVFSEREDGEEKTVGDVENKDDM